MVVEHVFVTTREWTDVTVLVSDLLRPHGFTIDAVQAFSIDPGVQQPLGMTRDKKALKKTRKLKPILTPTRLRFVFDRGRINLALAVEDAYTGGGIRFTRYSGPPKKIVAGRQKYLLGLAEIIQSLAAGYAEPEEAAARYAAIEEDVRTLNRQVRNRSLITLAVVFGAVFAVIVAAALLGSR